MRINSRMILGIQLAIGIIIIAAAVWYVGAQGLSRILASAHIEFIALFFVTYLGMNAIFAFRLVRVLDSMGHKIGFWNTLLIQYGGMLASDFTPARSGYFAVPVMMKDKGVPVSAGLSSIVGVQSIEFLVKMIGGTIAIAYLTSRIQLSKEIFILSIFAVILMLIGSGLLALAMWWKRATRIFEYMHRIPIVGRISSLLMGKISEFQKEAEKVKNIIKEIALLTIASWIVKGLEWYFIALALNIDQISWFGFFLLHPLITALSFLPLTPSGLGFQEGGLVGVLYLLGIDLKVGLAFAILVRTLTILEDLIGIHSISKVGVKALKAI